MKDSILTSVLTMIAMAFLVFLVWVTILISECSPNSNEEEIGYKSSFNISLVSHYKNKYELDSYIKYFYYERLSFRSRYLTYVVEESLPIFQGTLEQ